MTITQNISAAPQLRDMRPVISYGRISKRKSGDGAGAHVKIERQHQENADYLAPLFPGAEVITLDDNLSAWDPNVTRPGWEKALDLLASGQAQAIVGWHADRLTRQPIQGEQLLAACKTGNAQLHTTRSGHITNPLMFRIEQALAAAESDQKSARQKMKQDLLAKGGAFHGGRRRFGYEPGMVDIRESEAYWVRWLADGVLAGRSLKSMADELNERGVPTAEGNQWHGPNLGVMLRRPHLAGLRTHRGQVVGKADWPAILDQATYDAVHALLSDPDRRTSKSQARRYLLSSLVRCGVCGAKMRGRSNGRLATAATYWCQAGCVSRHQELTDAVVVDSILKRLAQVDVRGLLSAPEEPSGRMALEAKRDALNANLNAMARQAVLGTISQEMLVEATAAVREEVAKLDDQLASMAVDEARPQAVLQGVAGADDVAKVWAGLDLDRQRAIVDLLATVTIHKAARKGAEFDPELVQVAWKV